MTLAIWVVMPSQVFGAENKAVSPQHRMISETAEIKNISAGGMGRGKMLVFI
jgi:hypothetical protein